MGPLPRSLYLAGSLGVLLAWRVAPAAEAQRPRLHSEAVRIERLGKRVQVRAVNVPTLELLDALLEAGGLAASYATPELRQQVAPTHASYVSGSYERPEDALRGFCAHNGLSCSPPRDGAVRIGDNWAAALGRKGADRLLAEHRVPAPTPDPVPAARGIATGHVVYHGHYIPPPYRLAVTDTQAFRCAIRVNGLLVTASGFVPIPFRKPVPLPRSGVFESKRDALHYFLQSFLTWQKEVGRPLALERTRRFFRGPPHSCREVEIHDAADEIVLHYDDKRGELIDIPNAKKLAKLDPGRARRAAERHVDELARALRRGGLVVFTTRHGSLVVPAASAIGVLRRLVDIAEAQGHPFQKDRAILDIFYGHAGEDVNGSDRSLSWDMVANFRPSADLRERLTQSGPLPFTPPPEQRP